MNQWSLAKLRQYLREQQILADISLSWLNRMECQFMASKQFTLESSDFRSHEEREEAIRSYLTWRNRRRKIARVAWRAFRCRQRRRAA